jgi:hypothetical protein
MRFEFVINIETKNDELTRDMGEDELATMLFEMISKRLPQAPWIISTELYDREQVEGE